MKKGLLTVVRAEERAERMVAKAEAQKNDKIRQALDNQTKQLDTFIGPTPKTINLKPLDPELSTYEKLASKNREQAVKRILEELNASA